MRCDQNPLAFQCQKEDKKAKGFQISYLYLLVALTWHHGSDGVNVYMTGVPASRDSLLKDALALNSISSHCAVRGESV